MAVDTVETKPPKTLLQAPPVVKARHEGPLAADVLALFLRQEMRVLRELGKRPLVLCIGTDRTTGDRLGPLVGTLLRETGIRLPVIGTLDRPIDASNIKETILGLPADAGVLAVDATLGVAENVGRLCAGQGFFLPGAGVNKNLPAVGDLYLTGTVAVGGFMECFVLQNTRPSLVMKMARVMADAIRMGATGQ